MTNSIFERIARQVGVSPRTVQRVLTSELKDTRPTILKRAEKIRALARKLHYRPNAAARATRTGRFHTVAMLARPEIQPFQHILNGGVCDELSRHDLNLIYSELGDKALNQEEAAPRILREFCVDGLLLHLAREVSRGLFASISQAAIPAIWVNNRFETDAVHPDEFGAARACVQALLQRGFRHIVCACFSENWPSPFGQHFSFQDRLDGYHQAMQEAGLRPDCHMYFGHDYPEWGTTADRRVERARQILQQTRPDAIFAIAQDTAGPLHAAARQLGLQIPGDLAMVTLCNPGAPDLALGDATIQVPFRQVGIESARLLVRKMAEPEETLPAVVVPYDLSGLNRLPTRI